MSKLSDTLFDFTGRVIIVTGAAGAIGSETARVFAELGANVVLTDLNEEKVKAIAADIQAKTGKETLGIKMDSTNESDIQAMVNTVVSKFGKISGLVNNVGWGKATPLWGSDTDKMVKSYELNTVSAYNTTRLCMQYLKNEPNASVVFSGLMVGDTPSPEFIEYSTAKAGLINMAHSMAVASGPEVRFNVVVIGSVDNGDATLEAGYDPAMLRKISDGIVMKRRGTPRDIAYGFMFLMSEAANWITGINLKIDGGGMYESKMPS